MRTTFQFRPTAAEYFEALRHNQRSLLQRSRNGRYTFVFFLFSFAIWVGIGYCLITLTGQGTSVGWWLSSLVLAALALAVLEQVVKGRNVLHWIAAQLTHATTLTIGGEGLRFSLEHSDTFIGWQAIHDIEACGEHLLIYLNGASFVLLPSSAFTDKTERDALAAHLRSHLGNTTSGGAKAAAEIVPASIVPTSKALPTAGAWHNLAANLKAGLRLTVFLRPAADTPRVSWSQFVALALIGIAIPLATEMARIGLRGSFAWYALPAALYFLPVMVFAAWAIALLAGQTQRTLVLLTAMAGIAIPLGVLELLTRIAMEGGWLALPRRWSYFVYYLSPLWLAAASAVAAIRVLGIAKRRWASAFVLAALLIALPFSSVYHDSKLWIEPYDETAEKYNRRYMSLANEDTFYLQPKLLEQQLADLRPGHKGAVDLYFLGMAGYSGQDVFMKEVQTVSALFKDKFDTTGRSVMLINNPKTVAETPIASTTSLRLALNRIAEAMDRDEDILFLFLTSHGAKDHKFSLDFWPMRFNGLDPKRLRELLDESGIKRRVIVVSACYSGGFIEALKNDDSLVIAASAPDKNSFGCDNEAEYTYFGKAYFDEALRQTNSFVEAFEMAKPRIAERERKANHDPSDPRIHIGSAILAPLAVLAGERKASPPPEVSGNGARAPDIYDTYFDVIGLDKRVKQYRQECLREMGHVAPAVQIVNNPDAYGGITPSSRYWPQIVNSWIEYAESWCKATNDERVYREALRRAWLARPGDREVRAAIEFFKTPHGKQLLNAEEDVIRRAHAGLVDARAEITQPAVKRLQDEQARIVALHQREVAAGRSAEKASAPR